MIKIKDRLTQIYSRLDAIEICLQRINKTLLKIDARQAELNIRVGNNSKPIEGNND